MPQTQPSFQRSEDHSTGRTRTPRSCWPVRDFPQLALFILWLLTIFSVFICFHTLITSLKAAPAPKMGNDFKCASSFSTGKNNMFYLVLRTAAVNCICLYFSRIAVFKLDESLGAKMIDWAVVKIQIAPVNGSFASREGKQEQCKQWKIHLMSYIYISWLHYYASIYLSCDVTLCYYSSV